MNPQRTTEEFVFEGEDLDGVDFESIGLEEVFSYGSKRVFRFTRTTGIGCACENVERFDCPVTNTRFRAGRLFLEFRATDVEQFHTIVSVLKDLYESVSVTRLLRTHGVDEDTEIAYVDTADLTGRQREVVKTAYEMGYFEHPRGSNAGEVAASLGITTSTFTEHMAAAQRKILGPLFAD